MEFIRKKRKGQNGKVRRTWFSAEKYRIVWRKDVFGISVPARYQACVLETIPHYAGIDGNWVKAWGFVAKQRLHKTLKAAQDDCEKHYRLWIKACEASGHRALLELFGKLPIAIPVWARAKLNRKVYALLTEAQTPQTQEDEPCDESTLPASDASDPSGPTPASDTFAKPVEAKSATPTPALPAEDKDGSTIRRTRRVRSRDTDTSDASTAQPAKAADAEPTPTARKRTEKSSKGTRRKSVSTKNSSKRAKKPSKGSQKSKSKPSKN